MRAEKKNPGQRYNDYWDWILTGWNPVWIVSMVFGYAYYLLTTYEV